MNLPRLTAPQQKTLMTTTFKGYNHTESIQDGEMYDMRNLSGRSYPLLDQREKRAEMTLAGSGTILGVDGRAELVYIQGTEVYYDNQLVSGLSVSTSSSMLPKKITSMGAYVCIWPDKVYFNTVDLTDCGAMEHYYTATDLSANWGGIYMLKTDLMGEAYENIIGSFPLDHAPYPEGVPLSDAATEDAVKMLWIDIRNPKNHILKRYKPSTLEWQEIPAPYIRLVATNIAVGLSQYDTINLSGLVAAEVELSSYLAPDDEMRAAVLALNGERTVYRILNNNAIIINGDITHSDGHTLSGQTQQVNRLVPDLDFICESQNRLWGCKYGIVDGKMVNEIKACKQGDFKNWGSFIGTEADSYAAGVGTDGPFTGAASQRGYPVFFKEGCIHRVAGNTPSTYSITTIQCRGVQEGSWRSVVVANELIYYKSRDDIMAFDGSMPYSISAALGREKYSDARAGQIDGMYYISMMDSTGKWALFCYDTKTNLWHKEDDLKVLDFGTLREELYAIDETNNKMILLTGTNPEGYTATAEGDFDWYAVFGIFGTDYINKKYLSRFNIRMQMEDGAEMRMKIQYDQSGVWEDAGTIKSRGTKTFTLPVVPKRCDHMQVKLMGTGRCRIYSIGRVLEVGGDG